MAKQRGKQATHGTRGREEREGREKGDNKVEQSGVKRKRLRE